MLDLSKNPKEMTPTEKEHYEELMGKSVYEKPFILQKRPKKVEVKVKNKSCVICKGYLRKGRHVVCGAIECSRERQNRTVRLKKEKNQLIFKEEAEYRAYMRSI